MTLSWFIMGSVLVSVLEVHPLNADVMMPPCKISTLLGEMCGGIRISRLPEVSIELQTQLNFGECFTVNHSVEGQKFTTESFSVKFSGCLQFNCKGWKKCEKVYDKLT